MMILFPTMAIVLLQATVPNRIVIANLIVSEAPYSMPVEWRKRPRFDSPASDRLGVEHKWAVVECFKVTRGGMLRDCRARDWSGGDAEADHVALAAIRRSSIRLPVDVLENDTLLKWAAIVVTIRFDGLTTAPEIGDNCPPTICFTH